MQRYVRCGVESFSSLVVFLSDYQTGMVETFSSPRKRLFIGYILLAFLIAWLWLRYHGQSTVRTMRECLGRNIWWSSSARADYGIVLINRALLVLLSPLLLSQLAVATWLYLQLFEYWGFPPRAGVLLPDWAVISLFTLCLFLLDDFSRYFLHRLLHQLPILWAFHKMHHSARTLTPLTVLRTHPVEGVLFSLRAVFVQGLMIGLFRFFFGDQVDLYTVLGVNVLVFLFNVTGSNLRHSHVPIHYWRWLEHLLISPAQHQIHHSVEPRHYDRNFGAVLAVWDWLGGSLHLSEPEHTLRFGLSKQERPGEQQLGRLYLYPFAEAVTSCAMFCRRAYRAATGRNSG
ncbi:MAG: sterol desaturase family protein [Marinobacterium sp.]|nr:sterol desaturase family protein [Marinobacterium sp.]